MGPGLVTNLQVKIPKILVRVLSLPPHIVIKKAAGKAWRGIELRYNRQHDKKRTTYLNFYLDTSEKLYSYFCLGLIDSLKPHAHQISSLSSNHLEHRFDLLGSGWVQVKHGMQCRGLEGYRYDMGQAIEPDREGKWLKTLINSSNVSESQRLWRLIDSDYLPIDWHIDFKSGYRWAENTWYLDIPYSHKLGVDVKVPWELSRMQHLPQLAWAYALAVNGEADFAAPHRYIREFRNQILDFIATNPPRFGVNWTCTMDVAIRVANWLVAYDLFAAYGAEFDPEFEAEFKRSIYQHGLHIINNLEWSPQLRANHYLADIVGLLFVAAYLPRTAETDNWLAFAVQELITEVQCQFYSDGANFEASTCYHRLSAEMVVYATALVLGLPPEKQDALQEYDHRLHKNRPQLKPAPIPLYSLPGKPETFTPFPAWYIDLLEKMAEFTMHITKPNHKIPQIGDNDSGRFLKLHPLYQVMTVAAAKACYANLEGYADLPDDAQYWDEDFLDHRHLVAAINGLFSRDDFSRFTGSNWIEPQLLQGLAQGITFSYYRLPEEISTAEQVRIGKDEDWSRIHTELDLLPEGQKQILEIQAPGDDLREGMTLYAYPNFGLYLYRSKRLYLAIRCGDIGQNGNGGHAHNDQLSLELNVDGEDLIVDPGTYVYTPLSERRNEYRSVKAHFAPQAEGREPGSLELGLFRLGNEAKAKCLYFGERGFMGVHHGYGKPVYRIVTIESHLAVVTDMADAKIVRLKNCSFKHWRAAPEQKNPIYLNSVISSKYGSLGR